MDLSVKAYGFREMPDKLGVAFRTGEGIPDIVQLDETFFGVFLNGPSPFMDLSGLAKNPDWIKVYAKKVGGFYLQRKLLGLPQSLSAMMMYYRKDLFEEYEIDPKDLKTWEDFRIVGQELMDDHAQQFLALDGTLFDVFLRQGGSDLFSNDGKFLPNENIAEILTEFAEMAREQIAVMPDRGSVFDPVFFSGDLETGEVLCVCRGRLVRTRFMYSLLGMQGLWGMMPLPAWKNNQGKLGQERLPLPVKV